MQAILSFVEDGGQNFISAKCIYVAAETPARRKKVKLGF
jgi:hypothetical protein